MDSASKPSWSPLRLTSRQLEVFRTVAMIGSATKAAASLGVSQPAVSRALSDLEGMVGFKLFERRGGRLTPTHEGNLFYREAERHFLTLEAIERIAGSIAALRIGQLRITAMQAFANGLVPQAMAAFMRRYPDVPLVLDGRARSGVVEQVATGEVDIGVGTLPVDDAGVETRVVGTLPAMAILPASHPLCERSVLRPADMRGDAFIAFHRTSQFRRALDAMFDAAGVRRARLIEVHSSEAAIALVEQGAGVSIAMPFLTDLARNRRVRIVPFEPAFNVTLAILLPAGRMPSLTAMAFIEELKACVDRLWPEASGHGAG